MQAAQVTAQNARSAVVVMLFIAVTLVIFWRTALKLAIAIVTIGVIALIGYGAIVIWEGMHHAVR